MKINTFFIMLELYKNHIKIRITFLNKNYTKTIMKIYFKNNNLESTGKHDLT